MVERQDAIEEHQHAIGYVEISSCVRTDIFQLANSVVSKVSDGPGRERREARNDRRLMFFQQLLHYWKDRAGSRLNLSAAPDLHLLAVRAQNHEGPRSQEGVSPQLFPALHRLEQEGLRLLSC